MNHEVAFLDLRASYLEIKDELDAAYQRIMNSGWYILGEEVAAFEKNSRSIAERSTASAPQTDSKPCN